MNDLYRGTFVWTKGIKPRIIFRPGASPKHAWVLMCNAMAKEDGVEPSTVMRHFDWDTQKDVNFEIKIEIKYKEVEDGAGDEVANNVKTGAGMGAVPRHKRKGNKG